MELNKMIYCRKSTRSYTDEAVDAETIQKIKEFSANIKPLYPDIKVKTEIVDRENVKCILPWITPQLIAVFSEDKDGALENVGFMLQQLDLYMQSLRLGVCWLGMGRMNEQAVESKDDNLKFVIMLAFGYPKGEALRKEVTEFKRRPLATISDIEDERLEVARLAPSSVNSQPWYFTHDSDVIHAYCIKKGLFKPKMLSDMNRIDMGICLAHIYVANTDTFRFFKTDNIKTIKSYGYIGSFTI